MHGRAHRCAYRDASGQSTGPHDTIDPETRGDPDRTQDIWHRVHRNCTTHRAVAVSRSLYSTHRWLRVLGAPRTHRTASGSEPRGVLSVFELLVRSRCDQAVPRPVRIKVQCIYSAPACNGRCPRATAAAPACVLRLQRTLRLQAYCRPGIACRVRMRTARAADPGERFIHARAHCPKSATSHHVARGAAPLSSARRVALTGTHNLTAPESTFGRLCMAPQPRRMAEAQAWRSFCLCRQLPARITLDRLPCLAGVKAALVEARQAAASSVDSLEGDHEAACRAVACRAAACPVAACPVAASRAAACQVEACPVVVGSQVASPVAQLQGARPSCPLAARAETGTSVGLRRRLGRRSASCAPRPDHQHHAQVLPAPEARSWERWPFHGQQPCRCPDRPPR